MGEYLLRVKAYFRFTPNEWREFFITVFAVGFILSFRKWGSVTFDPVQGVTNLILYSLFVLLFLFLHVAAQKLLALYMGYRAQYTYWLNGIFVGVLTAFISYGVVPVVLTGTVILEHMPRLRLGRFRYGLNYKDVAKVSFAGPLMNVFVVLLLEPFYLSNAYSAAMHAFILDLIWINVLLALYSLLPFKNTNGLNIFFASRTAYVFCFFFVLLFSILVLAVSVFSIIISAVLAFLVAIIYATILDKP